MKPIIHIAILSALLLVGCNSTTEKPDTESAPMPSPVKKESALTLLSRELDKGVKDDSLFSGLTFGMDKKELLSKVAAGDEAILSVINDEGWTANNLWSVSLFYIPEQAGAMPMVLEARNTAGNGLDYVMAKSMFLLMSEATEEGPTEKSQRTDFINFHLKALKSQYGEPAYTTEGYNVPKELGTSSLDFLKGTAYFWFVNNQMIVLADVPLNYSITYSASLNGIPGAGQMMGIANVHGKIQPHNVWEIPYPINKITFFMLERALETKGYKVTKSSKSNKNIPEVFVKGDHPYQNLRFTLVPGGLYIKGYNNQSKSINDEPFKKWNNQLKEDIIAIQGKPSYSSKDGTTQYWLYKSYITQYKLNDDSIQLSYLSLY